MDGAAGADEFFVIVNKCVLDEVSDEVGTDALGGLVGLERRGESEGVGGVGHEVGLGGVELGEDAEAAEGAAGGSSGGVRLVGPETLAFGGDDEFDEVEGDGFIGGAFEEGDGVGVDGGAAFGDDEGDDVGADAGDVFAAEEVDDDSADGLGGADIIGGVGAGFADGFGVGEEEDHVGPAAFPAVLLEEHFVAGADGAGFGGIGEGELSEPEGGGEVFPGAGQGDGEFGHAVFVDDDAEVGHGGGDPAVVGTVEVCAVDLGGDGGGEFLGEWGEVAFGDELIEGGGAAAEDEVEVAGIAGFVLDIELFDDVSGAAAADVGPLDFYGRAVFGLMPSGEGGLEFASDVGAVRGDDEEGLFFLGGVGGAGGEKEGEEQEEGGKMSNDQWQMTNGVRGMMRAGGHVGASG